jgi:hypothetical protein
MAFEEMSSSRFIGGIYTLPQPSPIRGRERVIVRVGVNGFHFRRASLHDWDCLPRSEITPPPPSPEIGEGGA